MNVVRVALVGAGRAGMVHGVNLVEYVRSAEVTAIIESAADVAARAAATLGGPAVFSTLDDAVQANLFDAVVITTPTFTHADLAVTAARAGKHVFCEKPMALTLGQCTDMMVAAREAEVRLQIGFMRHFQPEFVEAKRRIGAGEIGEPMVIKSLTRGPGLPPRWAWDMSVSNGMLAEVNSHDFDCVRWLVGSDLKRVYAETINVKGAARGVDAANFYDNAVVALRFESNAVGTIDGTCPADYGYDARVEIVGSEGLLVIGDILGQPILQVKDRDTGAVIPSHRTWPDRFAEGYRAEMRAFVDSVVEGMDPEAGGEDGYHALCAVIAANRSWQEERPVLLAEVESL
jgi:myo-inositol 2-dehydrogenase / D-chiro-inositol 1-dehydrogenase